MLIIEFAKRMKKKRWQSINFVSDLRERQKYDIYKHGTAAMTCG